jgi:K+-transporting ATPase KdpF subunit
MCCSWLVPWPSSPFPRFSSAYFRGSKMEFAIAGIIALGLAAYLVLAMVRPEWF